MQKAKYLIFSILILFGLVLTGELYQSYMDVFNDFYSTTFYMQDDVSRDTMLSDIQEVATKNNVQVFCMETEVENMFTKNITVYGNNNVINTLKFDYYMHEGKIGSIFSGNTTVKCFDFFEIPDEMLLTENVPTFYLIGKFSDMEQMKRELVDIYAGQFPKNDGYSSLSEKKSTVIAVWCVIIILICFISFYTLTLNQRELMVRCTMGESKFLLFLKTILSDTVFLALWFTLTALTLQKFSNVLFLSKYSIPLFLLCIMSNIFVNCFIFKFRVREAFSKISGQKILITGTYAVKTLSCMLTALILTFQAATIKESISFYQQRKFFEKHKDYNYIRIYDKKNVSDGIETNLYYKYADKLLILDPMYDFGEVQERKSAVFANEKAYEVLREWIPELDSLDTDANICLIKHCDTEISESDISYLTSMNQFFGGEYRTVKIAEYQKNSKIIEIENNFLNYSEWCENPTIILVKNDHRELLNDEEVYSGSLDNSISLRGYNFMIDAPADELKLYIEHYGCGATITNTYEYYLYRWEVMKRSLYISLVFIVLILLLEIYISFMIIKLEYRINATELAVKKTLGYSNFERIKKLYLLTGICMGISFISSIIILYFIHQSTMIAPVIAIGLIALIEFPMIHSYSIRYEKKNVPEILKGGNV